MVQFKYTNTLRIKVIKRNTIAKLRYHQKYLFATWWRVADEIFACNFISDFDNNCDIGRWNVGVGIFIASNISLNFVSLEDSFALKYYIRIGLGDGLDDEPDTNKAIVLPIWPTIV